MSSMSDNYVHINIRRDTSANWSAEDPVLKLGEIAADIDKHGLKVGDGTKKWSELPFCTAEVINDLITGGTDKALSAEQGKVLKGLVDEKASKTDLTTLDTKITQLINNSTVDVIDNLTSTEQKKALSANQGKVLKGLIDGKASATDLTTLETSLTQIINNNTVDVVDNLTSTERKKALSANQGKVLKDLVDAKADKTTVNNLETSLTKIINGSTVEVIDNLTSTDNKKALSANQGRVLDDKINKINIFGIGYTVNSFNAYNKPTKITFSDGVVANLTWRGTQLDNITASTGEKITINYNNDGLITGRTVTGV